MTQQKDHEKTPNTSSSYADNLKHKSGGAAESSENSLREGASTVKDKLVESVVETSHQAEAKYRDAKAYVRNVDAEQAVSDLRSFIEARPLSALGMGIGLGYLLGKVLG